jgi:hypothetical protein
MIFSDTTNRTGIIQLLEDLTGTQDVSSYSTAVKTRNINLAFDDYQNLVKKVANTWQTDDSNHTKYPNMTFDINSGQQDYSFTVDEQGNQVQDIYRVECMDVSGKWRLLNPVDEMRYKEAISQLDTQSGTPTEYWKSANGIFLCVKPNYTQSGGIRMFFTRSPDYFESSDTTKEPGIPNGHHKYLAWKPAFWYWLPIDSSKANAYANEVAKIEAELLEDISHRNRDEKPGFRPRFHNYN